MYTKNLLLSQATQSTTYVYISKNSQTAGVSSHLSYKNYILHSKPLEKHLLKPYAIYSKHLKTTYRSIILQIVQLEPKTTVD